MTLSVEQSTPYELYIEGLANELTSYLISEKKKLGFEPNEQVDIYLDSDSIKIMAAIYRHSDAIARRLCATRMQPNPVTSTVPSQGTVECALFKKHHFQFQVIKHESERIPQQI